MPQHVVVIGGGAIGSSVACFLARDFGARVTVVERDPSYRFASSALSASSIRQQFSTAINIRVSQASLAFYRRIGEELAIGDERPDIGLVEPGYLFLASAAGAEILRANHEVQRACGIDVTLLAPAELQRRYPWLAVDGVALASLGLATATSGEGWFDGYSVLQAFRRKSIALGVNYVATEVARLTCAGARVVRAQTADGAALEADAFVLAAGAWSAPLARTLGFDLPVRARKRDVFVFHSPARLPGCPLVIDPSGLWFRPEGQGFICGAPPRGDDRDDAPLDAIDHGLFDEWIWPRLAARVPAFEALRRTHAWAGYYEFNTFDQNGLVGRVPGIDNAFVACGFSGHGIQQAPAVGRGIAELVATGEYRTLDLSPLSPQRVLDGSPLVERNVI
ncbi:MAG: FAD-binding oxidoreductase [Burkholderiaceae bacterium]|nr:FAD-binding oxidoreductase [Burkholderiaceae bacterium]